MTACPTVRAFGTSKANDTYIRAALFLLIAMAYEAKAERFVEAFEKHHGSVDDAEITGRRNVAIIARNRDDLYEGIGGDDEMTEWDETVTEAYSATVENTDKSANSSRKYDVFAIDSLAHDTVPTFVRTEYADGVESIFGRSLSDLADDGQVFVHPEHAKTDGVAPVLIEGDDAVVMLAPVIPNGVATVAPPSKGIDITPDE